MLLFPIHPEYAATSMVPKSQRVQLSLPNQFSLPLTINILIGRIWRDIVSRYCYNRLIENVPHTVVNAFVDLGDELPIGELVDGTVRLLKLQKEHVPVVAVHQVQRQVPVRFRQFYLLVAQLPLRDVLRLGFRIDRVFLREVLEGVFGKRRRRVRSHVTGNHDAVDRPRRMRNWDVDDQRG